MARTNWGPIILGMGLLGGGILVVVKWDKICPKIMSADKCTDSIGADVREMLSPITSEGIRTYNQRLSCSDPNNTSSNCRSTRASTPSSIPTTQRFKSTAGNKSPTPGKVTTQAQASKNMVSPANTQANLNNYCKDKPHTGMCAKAKCPSGMILNKLNKKCYKPITQYTNTSYYTAEPFYSFNTFTLNRMSVR